MMQVMSAPNPLRVISHDERHTYTCIMQLSASVPRQEYEVSSVCAIEASQLEK